MGETVSKGLYYGFNQAELTAELARYKAAVQQRGAMAEAAGGGVVSGGTLNNQAVSFSYPRGITSFEEWEMQLRNAQADLDDEADVFTNRTTGGFK